MLLNRLRGLSFPASLLTIVIPACGQFDADASHFRRGAGRPPPGPADTLSRPSPRELRQARADAWAEQAMAAQGGLIRYASDGSASRIDSVRFPATRNALVMGIRSDPLLNEDEGVPHALDFTVYHLRQPAQLSRLFRSGNGDRRIRDAFPGEAAEAEGIGEDAAGLLPGYRRDYVGAVVAGVERFSIQPGQDGVISLSRPEDGRYVALLAGYHRRDDSWANVLHVSEYPIGRYEQREKSGHFSRRTAMFRPLPLNLEVELGPEAMRVYAADRLLHPLRDVRAASALRVR